MKRDLLAWNAAVDSSFAGKDYPEGRVTPPDPESVAWTEHPSYQPHLAESKDRWEYQSATQGKRRGAKKR